MAIIVNDSFARANANPIGGIYVTGYGDNAVQIVSDQALASTGVSNNSAFDTTNSYPNDQWCQITIAAPVNGSSSEWQLNLRATNVLLSSNQHAYMHLDYGSSVASFGINTEGNLYQPTLNTAIAAGDVYLFGVQGQVYSFYQNGALIGSYTDSNAYATTGVPGFGFYPSGVVADSVISNWQSGNYLNFAVVAWLT